MDFDEFLKKACPPLDLQWRKYRRRCARHRVDARLQELGITDSDYAEYLKLLHQDPAEAQGLAERMRVTVSRFFREHHQWEQLADNVLPRLVSEKNPHEPLRIWSAGCCGGEEPYTIALLWLEKIQHLFPDLKLEILATDIDDDSLKRARNALYKTGSLREVPTYIRQRYFSGKNDLWQLKSPVTELVHFARHDLMRDALPPVQDLVCCRYLAFTYYQGHRRQEAEQRLHKALRPGGALVVGLKEKVPLPSPFFEPWPMAKGIFRKI